jgi:hypothetical protein
LLSFEIANSDGVDLNGGFREPGNSQDPARRRHLREILGEGLVQRFVTAHVVEIDLDINYVIHRQARSFDYGSYILERLANLIRKLGWSAPVQTARSLPGNIHIVSCVDSRGTQRLIRSRRFLRYDRS